MKYEGQENKRILQTPNGDHNIAASLVEVVWSDDEKYSVMRVPVNSRNNYIIN